MLYADCQRQASPSSGSRTTGGSSALSSSSSSSSSGSRGGTALPMITKGLQWINLVENSSGTCCFMLLLLGCGPQGILLLLLRFPNEGWRRTPFAGTDISIPQPTLGLTKPRRAGL